MRGEIPHAAFGCGEPELPGAPAVVEHFRHARLAAVRVGKCYGGNKIVRVSGMRGVLDRPFEVR